MIPSANYYLGADTGGSTGLVVLGCSPGQWDWKVVQVNADFAEETLRWLLGKYLIRAMSVEKIEPNRKGGNNTRDIEITRRLAHTFAMIGLDFGVPVFERNAGQVKPWANENRMKKTGFPLGAKFKDVRDAGRHSLFCSVRDGKERDPLL